MAAVAVQPRVAGMPGDAACVDVDGVPEASEIRDAASEPDRRIGARRIAIVVRLRAGRFASSRAFSSPAAAATRAAYRAATFPSGACAAGGLIPNTIANESTMKMRAAMR
jgi:hypothetical protein